MRQLKRKRRSGREQHGSTATCQNLTPSCGGTKKTNKQNKVRKSKEPSFLKPCAVVQTSLSFCWHGVALQGSLSLHTVPTKKQTTRQLLGSLSCKPLFQQIEKAFGHLFSAWYEGNASSVSESWLHTLGGG